MLICTVLMLGQMEIAVPVLPLPPQGLGKPYVSILRLPWVSCQRLRCGMQMRKRVLFQKSHIGKIPPSLAEGGGHGGPCALLSCSPSAFWGSAGVARADAWASYISAPRYVLPTMQPLPLPPGKACDWGTGERPVTAELLIFACRLGHRDPLSFAHLYAKGFLKPTKRPRVSFTSAGAIPPWPDQALVLWSCYMRIGFFGLMLQNLSLHLPA